MTRRTRQILATLIVVAMALGVVASFGSALLAPQPSASEAASARACTSDVLLAFLAERFDGSAADLAIASVQIEACANGYAHVFAIPRDNGPDGPSYDAEQFWLRWDGATWTIVAQGTGIACSDADRTPEHAAACDALGES